MTVINENNNSMQAFFTKVFMWMFIGLLISGGVAYLSTINLNILKFIYTYSIFICVLELIVVISFTFLRKKVSTSVAKIMFVIYSALSGLTLSSIFIIYNIGSILTVFLASSLLFGLLALYGYFTKQDLTSFGKLMLFGLIAIIIMSIINIFLGNNTFSLIIAIVAVILFLGLTAWDMQKLKMVYNYYCNDENELSKASIYGALDLYLDFVNIFLELLRLFGKRRD